MKATGNCFQNAFKYVEGSLFNTLVHCIVTGTGGEVEGVDFSHAFVISDNGNFAIDVTHDLNEPKIVPLELYRRVGNVREERHYDYDEAMKMALETGHYGAWDEALVTEADIEAMA